MSRLVTVTGTGGVGKTRLVIQVASALEPKFKDGACWVELAALFNTSLGDVHGPSHPKDLSITHLEGGKTASFTLVSQAVAKALRVPESPGLLLVDGVVEYLQNKQLLLVLDNCEHLIDDCALLAERLLADCQTLTILTTSREALGVRGEKAWDLQSLSLPDQEHSLSTRDLFQSEAVKLFVERAADALPGYRPDDLEVPTIAQICIRLGGIPLAIELAAARMNLLSAREISVRLDNRFSLLTGGHRTAPPRHQTLRAAIEWSFDLLSEPEQVLFRRLTIFSGSFTLEAAEAICPGVGIRSDEVLTLIGQLLGKSLLMVKPAPRNSNLATRYRFLDTIHSFGQRKLDEAKETRMMRERHANYYMQLVEAAEPELLLETQALWFRLLQAENNNLRAVIEWSVETDQAENALRLVSALVWFWFSYGSTREGCDLSLKALYSPSGVKNKERRAKALSTAGFLLYLLGDTALARQFLEEAISIQKTFTDKANLAWSLQFLGMVLAYDKEYNLADATFREGLSLTRELGGVQANNFLHFLGDIYMQKGDLARAQKIYEESITVLRTIGSKSFLAYPLRRLGFLTLGENEIHKAWIYFKESLDINIEVGDKRAVAASLTSLAALAMNIGKPNIAANLYGVVESRLEALSVNLLYMDQIELRNIMNKMPISLDEVGFSTAFSKGWEMSEEGVVELIRGLFGGLTAAE